MLAKERDVRMDLNILVEQKYIFWMQKSRTNWIINGDQNTRYYHIVTSRRRIRIKIVGILTKQGKWVENQGELQKAFYDYYDDISCKPNNLSEEQIKDFVTEVNLWIRTKSHGFSKRLRLMESMDFLPEVMEGGPYNSCYSIFSIEPRLS